MTLNKLICPSQFELGQHKPFSVTAGESLTYSLCIWGLVKLPVVIRLSFHYQPCIYKIQLSQVQRQY